MGSGNETRLGWWGVGCRGGSRILKGGFFLLLLLAGHTQLHPFSIVFLAKGGGVLPNFENNRRTPPRSTSGGGGGGFMLYSRQNLD